MNDEQLSKLISHNENLVRTAAVLRDALHDAHAAMLTVIDAAVPIAEQHEYEPSEYILPVDDVEEMRRVLIRYKKEAA